MIGALTDAAHSLDFDDSAVSCVLCAHAERASPTAPCQSLQTCPEKSACGTNSKCKSGCIHKEARDAHPHHRAIRHEGPPSRISTRDEARADRCIRNEAATTPPRIAH